MSEENERSGNSDLPVRFRARGYHKAHLKVARVGGAIKKRRERGEARKEGDWARPIGREEQDVVVKSKTGSQRSSLEISCTLGGVVLGCHGRRQKKKGKLNKGAV